MRRMRSTYQDFPELQAMRSRTRRRERMTGAVMVSTFLGTVAAAALIVYALTWVVGMGARAVARQASDGVRRDFLPSHSALPAPLVDVARILKR